MCERYYTLSLKQIGNKLKQARNNAGLSQEKVSEINNIDYKYYQRIESGCVNITIKTLLKLSKSLKIEPSELLKK